MKGENWDKAFHSTGLIADHSNIFAFGTPNLSLKDNYDVIVDKINESVCRNIINHFEEKELETYDIKELLHENPVT